jgi:hypothetical protein
MIDELHTRDLVHRIPLFTRLILRLFRRRLNRDVFYPVLGRAYETGAIDWRQLHELHHHFDPTQHGVVGRA